MIELISRWNVKLLVLEIDANSQWLSSLHVSHMLSRNDVYNDYHVIDWQALMIDISKFDSLDYVKSKQRFFEKIFSLDVQLMRHWDVDSFIVHVITLKIHRHSFKLSYCSLYLQRITQNQRVIINDFAAHDCKQLRLSYNVANREHDYNTHVLFSHMSKSFEDITHLTLSRQTTWIDDIVRSTLKVIYSNHVIARHSRSFEDAHLKVDVKREVVDQKSSQSLNLNFALLAYELTTFWIEIKRLTNALFDFRELTLVLSIHDLKLITTRSNSLQTRVDFLHHLKHNFDISKNVISSREIWVNFDMNDFSIVNDFLEITLLSKISCLFHWKNFFINSRDSRVCLNRALYSFLLTRDVCSMSIELISINWLRFAENLIYHKFYNIVKNFFSILMKNILLFCNVQLKKLDFIQSKLDRWSIINKKDVSIYVNLDDFDDST